MYGNSGNTPSLARLIQDFGQRWEIERISRSTEWVAVLCDGSRHKFVWASELDTLRLNLESAERDEAEAGSPDER